MSSDSSRSSRRRMEYLRQYSEDLTLSTKEEEEEEQPIVALNVNKKSSVESPDQSNTLQQFDKMVIDLPWNTTNVNTKKSLEDPVLSQKITTATTANNKGSLMKDIQAEMEKVPTYLAKGNKSFQQIVHQARSRTIAANTTNFVEDFRKVAILLYKIRVLQTYHLLWTTYFQSGIGQLIVPPKEPPFYSTTIRIWPKEIKILLPLTTNEKINENTIYFNFVHQRLHEFNHHLKQYQTELNTKANNFDGYTFTIQKLIETYIEQNLQSFRLRIEHQIALIHYDYHIRALKLEYFRHQPTVLQEQLMKQICQSKYEQETTKQEYHLLQEQINYFNSPSQSFEYAPPAQLTLLDSITNSAIRKQLFQQYRENTVQSRDNLFHLYLKSAEDQREKYKKKYEDSVQHLWSDHHALDRGQQTPRAMIQLIEQRCQKISERIQCVYRFKAQSNRDQLFKQYSE